MSYDIRLTDPVTGEEIEFDTPHTMRGGTYQVGGTTRAWLNITYNYSKYYYDALPETKEKGIRTIYGMTGADSIDLLERMAATLSEETDSNYWKATPGNAKRPLLQLIAMAKMRPDGIWTGD